MKSNKRTTNETVYTVAFTRDEVIKILRREASHKHPILDDPATVVNGSGFSYVPILALCGDGYDDIVLTWVEKGEANEKKT